MFEKFLKSIDDPKRPLLGRNIWLLKAIGMVLPEEKRSRIRTIVIHEIVTVFVITQLVELYIIRSDVDKVLTNLRITLLSFICIVKSNTCVLWQKDWIELLDYVTEADNEEREDLDSTRAAIHKSYLKTCRNMTYFYWVMLSKLYATFMACQVILIIQFQYALKVKHLDVSETDFEHIFSSWMPFDKYTGVGFWATLICHAVFGGYGAGIMAAYDVNVMVIMIFFGGKLDMLRERCKLMLGTEGKTLSDEEAHKMIRKMHRTHLLLVKYSRMFNSLLSPVMFLYVVICSLVLCASAVQISNSSTFIEKLFMGEYLTFGVTQLFLFCWNSNNVLYKSDGVMLGPYESDWQSANLKHRRSVLLLAGQLNKKVYFTAGPFTDLTLPTFINILKGAYSYYTLFRK